MIIQFVDDLLKLEFAGADMIMSLESCSTVCADAASESVQQQEVDSDGLENLRHWLESILNGTGGAYQALNVGRVSFSSLSDDLFC